MNYGNIIRNRDLRLKMLELTSFIPDKVMLQLQYRAKLGRKLNLKHPKRYSEKIQWYKLYYRDPVMAQCSDKYTVREYVKSKGLANILNDIYGVYNNVSEINYKELPEKFVLKATNGAGGNNNIFCEDKESFDAKWSNEKLQEWITPKRKTPGREWVYESVKPRIIAEKLLPRDKNNDLPDYKFFCFDGEVYCLYTMIEYVDSHENGKLGFYDIEFNKMNYRRMDFKPIDIEIEKPKNFDKMIEIAKVLSEDFPHVRVDLYNIDGQIIFGELTFFTASGYTQFGPDKFDFILGEKFKLPSANI